MIYLRQVVNSFRKYLIFNFLRVIVLSLGLGTFFILILYLVNETSYNKFNKNYKDIFFVSAFSKTFKVETPLTPMVLGQEIVDNSPYVMEKTTFTLFGKGEIQVNDNWSLPNIKILGADTNFTKIFSFKFLFGDGNNYLKSNNTVLISHKIQQTYFPDENPVGKVIKIRRKEQTRELIIEGVYEIPRFSSIAADLLISEKLFIEVNKASRPKFDENSKNFNSFFSLTFILKNRAASVSDIEEKVVDLNDKYSIASNEVNFKLIPLKDLHYYSKNFYKILPSGNENKVRMFGIIALILTFLTYSNFIVLSLAINIQDMKKYCTMKIYGAGIWNIFIIEFIKIILITVLSIIGGLFIARILLPAFNQHSGVNIHLEWLIQHQYFIKILPIILGLTLISSLFIGIYSSLFDTKYILRNTISGSTVNSKVLIFITTFQFILFFILLSSSIIINRQTRLLFTKDMGFDKSDLVIVPLNSDQSKKYDTLKNKIIQLPIVESVTGAANIFLRDNNYFRYRLYLPEKPEEKELIFFLGVDNNFISTMKLDILSGRDFKNDGSESMWSIIVNEEFVRTFHMKNPLGKSLNDDGHIIGVVKDFHFENMKSKIKPLIICPNAKKIKNITIKVNSKNISEIVDKIENEWQEVFPDDPFNYLLYDDILNQTYKSDMNFYNLINAFTLIAMIISSIGLYTISLFYASRRLGEVAIRKVVGANSIRLYWALVNRFLKFIALSLLFSVPIKLSITNRWLMSFAYKIDIGFFDFFTSVLIGMIIILLTTLVSIAKIIRANPVDILRNE